MSITNTLSLYHTIANLKDSDFEVVMRMLQGLTDETYSIERLSEEEAALYREGFDEIERGEYITLEQFRAGASR
ncbi:hypothetical protein FACS18949_08090 [Clostridia bacterium]|nr:hypothetical protein FACS18949_08090 [Clostridia bacterium]